MKLSQWLNHVILMSLLLLTAQAITTENDNEDPRIIDLLPGLVNLPAVEPSIPEDFVAMAPSGKANIADWVYWGPEKVLLNYFKDPESLSRPILRVKLSANVIQTGPDSFSSGEGLHNLPGYDEIKVKWGSYPILAIRVQMEDKLIFSAWIGLNAPTGDALLANLVYPSKKGHPNKKDRELWKDFLLNTKPLPDQLMVKVYGQDMQDGYTIVSVNGTKLKVIAERRKKDKKLRIAAIPLEGDVKLELDHVEDCLMGLQWKYGEPLAKVYGTIIANNKNLYGTVEQNQVTNILIKTVDSFSVSDDEIKNNSDIVIYEE